LKRAEGKECNEICAAMWDKPFKAGSHGSQVTRGHLV
jgi:hypothetical protein